MAHEGPSQNFQVLKDHFGAIEHNQKCSGVDMLMAHRAVKFDLYDNHLFFLISAYGFLKDDWVYLGNHTLTSL